MTTWPVITIDAEVCTGCEVCVHSCPTDVLRMKDGKAASLYPDDCQSCFLCVFDCAYRAISIAIPRLPEGPKWWDHWARSEEAARANGRPSQG